MEPDNPIWRFALAFWRKPGAQQTCLALQDQGWSVTRILCAGWLALEGRPYSGTEHATLTEWRQHVTGALRAVRKSLPKGHEHCQDLRDGVAGLELQAEQLELALAWQQLASETPDTTLMTGNAQLIRNNLAAAAYQTDQVVKAADELNTLASILAPFSNGDSQP
nr:TIGR02444 family protein [Marinobacter sp. C7]